MFLKKGCNGLMTLIIIEFVRYWSIGNTVQQCKEKFLCSANFWMLLVIINDLNVLYWRYVYTFD
ncbi:MAG: hypothetical protein C4B59_17480 [Candidatus Methanogaster sp.]|uniref:Uncharacterized protein n=1 Tax=Candidatus Methanogaster sp. TaxID=3386292 RepID=A0AC61KXV8_9EURY|nr:MAG: hypothetical protein C4B59_17480 [ANME-2 cluster archaeon]